MKHLLTRLLSALLSIVYIVVAYTLGHHAVHGASLTDSKTITWERRGNSRGCGSAIGAVYGDSFCCAVHYGQCGSDACCGTSNCMPLHSTGCRNQVLVNMELVHSPKRDSKRQGLVLDSLVLDGLIPDLSSMTEQPTTSSEEPVPEEHSSKTLPFPSLDYLARLARPNLGATPYGQVIASCTVPGTLALTFDDGPWRYTSDLLDLLDRERVRATFFVCGGNMAKDQLTNYGHPQLLRRMITSGHQIGTHTWAHPNLAGVGRAEVARQMYLNEQALVGILGLLPTYFRPPYIEWSSETLSVMTELGYHVITLDVDTRDWEGDYDAAKQNFLASLGWGSDSKLVLAHDIHERTVYDFAEWMIDTARGRGYRLVTVGECLGDPVDNWYRSPYTGDSWQGSVSLLVHDASAHPRRAERYGDGKNPPAVVEKQPKILTDDRRPDMRNSARTPTRNLRVQSCMAGLILVFAVFFMFL